MPLKFDQNTLTCEFCPFTWILLDVDLSKWLPKFIMLNKAGGAITVFLEFENLLAFCPLCHSVGHVIANCKRLDRNYLKLSSKDNGGTSKNEKSKSIFVVKKQGQSIAGVALKAADVKDRGSLPVDITENGKLIEAINLLTTKDA